MHYGWALTKQRAHRIITPCAKIYRSPKFTHCSLLSFAAVISACTMKTLRFPSPWQLLVCQEWIVLMQPYLKGQCLNNPNSVAQTHRCHKLCHPLPVVTWGGNLQTIHSFLHQFSCDNWLVSMRRICFLWATVAAVAGRHQGYLPTEKCLCHLSGRAPPVKRRGDAKGILNEWDTKNTSLPSGCGYSAVLGTGHGVRHVSQKLPQRSPAAASTEGLEGGKKGSVLGKQKVLARRAVNKRANCKSSKENMTGKGVKAKPEGPQQPAAWSGANGFSRGSSQL